MAPPPQPLSPGPSVPSGTGASELRRADSLVRKGDTPDALEIVLRVLQEDPANIAALERLGMIYSTEIPDLEKARHAFKRILALAPENEFALRGLSVLVKDDEESREVSRYYRELLERYPQSATIADVAAEFFESQGDEEMASRLLKIAGKDPQRAYSAHNRLAQIYEKQGKLEDAVLNYRQSIQDLEAHRGEDLSAWEEAMGRSQLLLAGVLLNTGRMADAQESLRVARQYLKDETLFESIEQRIQEESAE